MSTRAEVLLPLSVPAAVTAVVYVHLEAGASALAGIDKEEDTEALHNFRLAVRRLRSILRAYRPWLGKAAGRKVERSLRRLGRATNDGRDAEVRLAWIERQRVALPRRERKSARPALRELEATKRKSYQRAKGRVHKEFTRTAERLVKRLEKLESSGPSLADVLPPLLRRQIAELEVRLIAVGSGEDREGAHEARIAGKRLRYLLEPLAKESDETRLLLERLKKLHDLLGETNDLHLVEDTLDEEVATLAEAEARRLRRLADQPVENGAGAKERKPENVVALEALGALARTRRGVLFAELDRDWLDGRGREFFLEAERVADGLGISAKPVTSKAAGKEEQSSPRVAAGILESSDEAPRRKERTTLPEVQPGRVVPERGPESRAARRSRAPRRTTQQKRS